jgi:hypothetical protein
MSQPMVSILWGDSFNLRGRVTYCQPLSDVLSSQLMWTRLPICGFVEFS